MTSCQSGYAKHIKEVSASDLVSFHQFLTSNLLFNQWKKAIPQDYTVMPHSDICSAHFCEYDYHTKSLDTNSTKLGKTSSCEQVLTGAYRCSHWKCQLLKVSHKHFGLQSWGNNYLRQNFSLLTKKECEMST